MVVVRRLIPDIPRTGLFGLGALLLCFACGPASSLIEPSGPVSRDELSNRIASAYCSNIGPCCAKGGFPYSQEECVASMRSLLDSRYVSEVAEYDARKAEACIEHAASVATGCEEPWNPTLVPVVPGPCDEVFIGVVPAGGDCAVDNDCVEPSPGAGICLATVCATRTKAGLGEPCNSHCAAYQGYVQCGAVQLNAARSSCDIQEGLYCGPSAICEPLPELGEQCDIGHCVSSYCAPGTNSFLCRPESPEGDSCKLSFDCGRDTSCNELLCFAALPAGSACRYDADCEYGCIDGRCTSVPVAPSTCSGADG